MDLGDYFNEENIVAVQKIEALKKEFLWTFNGFKQPEYKENLDSISRMFITLLFLEKGSYPDSPKMGIGIQNYQFELMNDRTLDKMKEEIEEQVNIYLPNIYMQNLIVKKLKNSNNKSIGIGMEIASSGLEMNEEFGRFFLLLEQLPDSRDVVSQVIYE